MPQRTIETYENGVLVETRFFEITQEQANEEAVLGNVQAQAQAAITSLRAYRALSSPTQAATVTVVKLLCLVVIQLIRLVMRRFDEQD